MNNTTPSQQTPPIDIKTGLTKSQVSFRIENGQSNTLPVQLTKSTLQIIKGHVFTFFNLIFFLLALLVSMVGDFRSLTFLPVIVVNMLVGIVQEIRSQKALEKLTMLHAPQTQVLRDGKTIFVNSEALVVDDIVLFGAGNQIPADAILLFGEVQVNEALLTGEEDEITKHPDDELHSGSFVVSGTCTARLVKVGHESGISRLTLEAKKLKGTNTSQMVRELNQLLKIVGILIIPIGILLFLNERFILENSVSGSVVAMVAAIIGMIPEGLYLLTTATLVLSVLRLTKAKVLVREMSCIETLARVNVLCVDKTGTITDPIMHAVAFHAVNNDKINEENTLQLLANFASAMDDDNQTIHAIKAFFPHDSTLQPLHKSSFSSQYKYSSATFHEGCLLVGAPEFVLREEYKKHQSFIESYSAQGYRTLAVAMYDGVADGKALTNNATLLGIFLLENPVRKEAKATFSYFAKQGVEIKVISGDNPLTVSRVASQVGIQGAENYIDASTLKTEEETLEALRTHQVFGRVVPAQKRQFVQLLQKLGKTVAMTGDGVNDVLALKEADCSIAMASGSDAASQVAQLVLLESDFSAMPDVVNEGRHVVNNIERSASLFLVKNIFSFIMAALSVLFSFRYPTTPAQMSLISGLTIGVPAFLLALEKNHNMIKGRFLKNVLLKALPAGITNVIMVLVVVCSANLLHMDERQIATASLLMLSAIGMMVIYFIARPMNKFRLGVLGLMVLSILFCLLFLSDLFQTVSLPTNALFLVGGLILCAFPLITFLTACFSLKKQKQISQTTKENP